MDSLHLYLNGSPFYSLVMRALMPLAFAALVDLQVSGAEHIPSRGPFIIASNHVDNLDSYVVVMQIPRVVHYLARPSGLRSRWLGRYWRLLACIPADVQGFKLAVTLLKEGQIVGIFPEGVIAPALVRAKPGLALLALRSGAPVLPCAIWGTERVLRGSKVALRRQIHLRFGEPQQLARGSGHAQDLSDAIMCSVAALLPPSYRGCYGQPPAEG